MWYTTSNLFINFPSNQAQIKSFLSTTNLFHSTILLFSD